MIDDSFNLARFVEAQAESYDQALAEIRRGRKETHWMWFIFPQIAGLGTSAMAWRYAITGRAEAEAYWQHPILGPRLRECVEAVLHVQGRSAADIFGELDAMKLRSCATLFASVAPPVSIFAQVLDQSFSGEPDHETMRRLTQS